MTKICPLLMETGYSKYCMREQCAWWVVYSMAGNCAIKDIALELIAWRQERNWGTDHQKAEAGEK